MKKRVNRHPDHGKRHNTPSPNNQVIAAHLEETPKHWEEIPGAGHDNVLVTNHPIYADIAEWMIRHVTTEIAP